MCKIQCLLAVTALCVGLVNSWDIAITTGGQIEFYTNDNKTDVAGQRFRDLSALAYDAVHNMLLFVDKQNDNASIFSYQLSNKKYQSLVKRRSDQNIQGLAFDPVKGLLFWTDANERSIFWISLKNRTNTDPYGTLLLKMNDDIPRAIAVDSCRGYIYWTNINYKRPTIERAKFDGSERTVIVDKNIFAPVSIAVDVKTQKLYWLDDKEGVDYSIETSDLNGKNRDTVLIGSHHRPNALTISNNSIYWVDWDYNSVWKIPKDVKDPKPETVINMFDKSSFGIVANYNIQDQIKGIEDCDNLVSMAENKVTISDLSTSKISPDEGLFCLHGEKLNGKACRCSPGYRGDRCDVSLCHQYCLGGDCSIGKDGNPQCRCKPGFTGTRCETNVCDNHCLNNGACYLENAEPVCRCVGDYEGPRCETPTPIPTLIPTAAPEPCNCTNSSSPVLAESREIHYVDVSGCDSSWDSVRDPVIMTLGIICGLLCISSTFLCTKVMKLKKRPRIKKRIIVNKNVTPMTARPDQCEITIENCCNMNICETPCFEPRSTIRPTLLDSKPGKEEKKNLISNMEYPEDY